MKYSVSRKLNLGRLAGLQYESMDLMILEADTKEEAMKELNNWIKEVEDEHKPEQIKVEPKEKLKEEDIPF